MSIEISYFFLGIISLLILNYLLIKFNFLLENENKSSHRKIFLPNQKKYKVEVYSFNNINNNYFSAKYLSNNNFDFNVCFRHVIRY